MTNPVEIQDRIFHVCEAFICKAFKGAAVVGYCKPLIAAQMDASDTPAGVEIFEKLNQKIIGTNCHF
jgi:hypothetical protein